MPMLLFAVAALAPPSYVSRISANVQATATIRIVKAVALKLDGSFNPDAPPARMSVVKSSDGSILQLKVIEFQ